MACLTQKQLDNIFKSIGNYFKNLSNSLDYSHMDHLSYIYNKGISSGIAPATALSYVQVVPKLVNTYKALTGIKLKKEEAIALAGLESDFEDNDLNFVAETLGLTTEKEPEEITEVTSDEVVAPKGQTLKIFTAKTNDPTSTTGPDERKDDGTQSIDPKKTWYHGFTRKLIANAVSGFDGSTITIKNHTGFKLKAIKMSEIPYEELYDFLKTQSLSEEQLKAILDRDQIVALVITDNNGKILKFNQDYAVVPDGKLIYFQMRDTNYDLLDVVGARGMIQSVEEISNNLNISYKEAERRVRDGVNNLRAIQKGVFENKNVMLDITGGSRGYLPLLEKNVKLNYQTAPSTLGQVVANMDYFEISYNTTGGTTNRFITLYGNTINLFTRKANDGELKLFTDAVVENLLKSDDTTVGLEFLSQYLAMTNSNKNELKKLLESIKESRDKENGADRLKKYLETAGSNKNGFWLTYQKELPEYFGIKNGELSIINREEYYNFWKDVLKTALPLNDDNKVQLFNSYMNFEIDNKTKETLGLTKFKEPKIENKTSAIIANTNFDIDSLMKEKGISSQATKKQIQDALDWYENSPLKNVVPVNVLFNVLNSNSKAVWERSGITLFFGSNYTDLYHEAWHAFSQLFLTIEDKQKLYAEIGKMSGTFALPGGGRIKYSDAKPVQIEELLAEDFRQYRLSNGTKVFGQRPVTNSIFSQILKLLNWLFDKVSYQQTQTDFNSLKNVKTLYDKLYLGNFIDMKPDAKNIMFGSLASPIGSVENGTQLTITQSNQIADSMDAIISDVLENISKETGKVIIGNFLNSKNSVKYIYGKIKEAFEKKVIELSEDVVANEYAINLLNIAISDFGNIDETIDNKKLNDSTTISYHLRRSKILDFKTKTLDDNDEKTVDLDTHIKKELADNGELSFEELANERVLFLIKTLKQYDSNGNVEMNDLGFPKLVKFNKVLGILIRELNNNSGPKSIRAKLEALRDNGQHEIGELLIKLGDLDLVKEDDKADIMNAWILFANSFNTTSLPLIITRLEQTTNKDDNTYEYSLYNTQGKLDLSNTKRKFIQEFSINRLNRFTSEIEGLKVIDKNKLENFNIQEYNNLQFGDSKKFNKAVLFYNAIGIPVGKTEEYKELLSNKTVLEGVTYIYNMLMEYKSKGKNSDFIPDHLNYLTKSKEGNQSNVIDTVIQAYLKVEDIVSTFSLLNAEGNRQYENVLNNTITITKNGLNDVNNFVDFYSKPEFAHFNPAVNPMVRNSQVLKKLFGEDLTGRIDTLNLSNYSGIQLDKDGVNVTSISITETDTATKFYIDLYSYINNGYVELPRHADKKMALAYHTSKNPHFITPTSYYQSPELSDDKFFNIMFGYLKAEHERVQDIRNNTISDLNNFPEFKNQGKEFLIFHDILTPELKNKLYDTSIEELAALNSDTQLHKEIKDRIVAYLTNLTSKNKVVFDEMNYLDADSIRKLIKPGFVNERLSNEEKANRLVRAYSANSFISFVESTILFYGDIAAYKLLKEEFHKRNASAGSTGRTFISDPEFLYAYKKHFGNKYANKQGYKSYGVADNGVLRTAVFDDIQVQNDDLIAEYKTLFENQYTKDYTAFGLTGKALTDKVEAEVNKSIAKYFEKEIKEGDGQGWLTFDAYRMLAKLSNEWSPAQEELYNKIVEGKDIGINEIVKNFPPRKYQYYGPIVTEKYHLNALHKFSLMPLIPSVIKGTNLEQIHERMMKSNVQYATFKSGSKTATRTYENGKSDQFYSDLSVRKAMPKDAPLLINEINIKYLRNQVSINDEFKEEVVFSTQMRKLIINELFEKGIPLNANVEKLVKSYLQNIERYIEFNKQELRDEIELKSDGKFNAESLAKIIKIEMSRRDFPEHLQDTVTKIENGNFAYDLSYALNAEDIEKILFSIVNKRIVRRKVNGEPLIQAAVSGFEKERPDLTNATEDDLVKYKADELKFYRRDPVTGKTLPMQVKIALQGKFKKLLYLEHNGQVIGTRDNLNKALKDPEWMKVHGKMVTLGGVRIPVQGFNSMEMMEVAEFLDEAAGNIVVAPTQIVSKSGGDFDIDKLSIFFPNIEKVGNKIFLSRYDRSIKESTGELKGKISELKKRIKEIKGDSQKEFENLKKQKEFSKLESTEKQLINQLYENYNRLIAENNDLIELWSKESVNTRKGKILSNEIDELKNISISFEDKFQELTLAEAELKQNLKVYYGAFYEDKQQKFWDAQDIKLQVVFDEMNIIKEKLINSSNSAYENDITQDIVNILSAPEIAAALVRPNDTDLVQPLSKQMLKYFAKSYNPKENFNTDSSIMEFVDDLETDPKKKNKIRPVSPTRIFETRYNIYKQFSNSVGKKALGIGAVDNAYNALFNQVGLYLNDEFEHVRTDKKSGKDITQIRKNRLLLDHNKMNNGKISLSNIFNREGTKISDLINQLINGWVDVAKDPWIAYVMGTPEATPSLLYLVQAGVPFKQAVYFLANPLVREYFDTLKKMESPLAALSQSIEENEYGDPVIKSTLPENEFRLKARMLGYGKSDYPNGHQLYDRIQEYTKGFENITEKELFDRLEASTEPDWSRNETDMAVFAHFLEILDVAKGLFKIKSSLNFDTKTSATMYDAYARSQKRDLIVGDNEDEINVLKIFPKDKLKALYEDTILSNFDVSDMQMEMFKDLYGVRNNPNLNKYLYEFYKNSLIFGSNIYDRVKQIFGGNDKMISEFKNDFTTAITLSALRDIDITETVYKGYEIVQVNSKEYEKVINKKVNKSLPTDKLYFAKNNYTKDTPEKYPKYGFIFTENAEMLGTNKNVASTQAVIRTNKQGERNPNALAIVTKKMQKAGANFTNSEADFTQFKELNTELINNIVDSKFERIIVPTGGFAMEKAQLPTRFAEWLQNELQTKLGIATELVDRGTGMSGLTNSKKYEEAISQQKENDPSDIKLNESINNLKLNGITERGKELFKIGDQVDVYFKKSDNNSILTIKSITKVGNNFKVELENGTGTKTYTYTVDKNGKGNTIEIEPDVKMQVFEKDNVAYDQAINELKDKKSIKLNSIQGKFSVPTISKLENYNIDRANTNDEGEIIKTNENDKGYKITFDEHPNSIFYLRVARYEGQPTGWLIENINSGYKVGNIHNTANQAYNEFIERFNSLENLDINDKKLLDVASRVELDISKITPGITEESIEVEQVPTKGTNIPGYIPVGVYIQDDKMYVDKDTLYEQFETQEYSNNNTQAYGTIITTPEGGKFYLQKVSPRTFNDNFSEYVKFVMEREYQRSVLKATDITNFDELLKTTTAKLITPKKVQINITELQNKLKTDVAFVGNKYGLEDLVDVYSGEVIYNNLKRPYKGKPGIYEQYTITEEKESAVKYKIIESYLTNKALKNILNSYSYMQDPENAYAKQLLDLVKKYELAKDYSLLDALTINKSNSNDIFNLVFKEGKPDSSTIDNYIDELMRLSNPDVEKHPDIYINKEISEFFDKFQYYVLLSSGFSSGNRYSLNSIVSQEKILNFTNSEAIKKTTNRILNDSDYYGKVEKTLNIFTDKFLRHRLGISVNPKSKIVTNIAGFSVDNSNRIKKYISQGISKPVTEYPNVDIFDDTLKKVNDSLYLIDLDLIRQEGNQAALSGDKLYFTKAVLKLAETHDDKLFIFTSNDKIPPTVKASNISIFNTPEQIRNAEFDGPVILSSTGLKGKTDEGTAMLSEALFEKFRIKNPGFQKGIAKLTIREMMNSDSFITSVDVIDSIRLKSHAILDELNNSCNI